MDLLLGYRTALEEHLKTTVAQPEPEQLYEPIRYILGLGGKRLRPILTLMTCDFFGQEYQKAMPAALAVELFHNFSLIHDDIMDEAPLRRGHVTVHEKWDLNTGILSGDAMLILAYQLFEVYPPEQFQRLARLFSITALQVCEGQQYDVDFETRNDVTIGEYIQMINYKTAVLLGAAMKMGALIANATDADADAIYEFGRNLGIAFQLQDDYLDAFGNPETFGKQVGGDIIANKKTYLYLRAMELASSAERAELLKLFNDNPEDPSEKIARAKSIFNSSEAAQATQQAIKDYSDKAYGVLDPISMDEKHKETLRQFGYWLMKRKV